MNSKSRLSAAVLIVLSVGSGASFAQGILDQQLGSAPPDTPAAVPVPASPAPAPTTPTPADVPKAAAAPENATPAAPKPATDTPAVMNPDAAKQIDDSDLINKLTHSSGDAAKPASSDLAQNAHDMVQRMEQSQTLLQKHDTGPVTQETQRRILSDLVVLIEYARKIQPSNSSQQDPGPPQPGDSRSQPGPHNEHGTTAANQSTLPGGGVSAAVSNETDFHQRAPEEWGKLPPRDRDLVSHGANEEFLPSYREMIDGYYKALSELGRTHN